MKRYNLGDEPFSWPVEDATFVEHDLGTWVLYTDASDLKEKITELEEKLEIAMYYLNAIKKTKISGADVYSGAESMVFNAREALERIK